MWVVVGQRKVLVLEVEDALHIRIDVHLGQWARLTGELKFSLLDVVKVEMGVARCIDEIAWLQIAHLRHHHGKQRIGGNVERHTEEGVGTALIELAT